MLVWYSNAAVILVTPYDVVLASINSKHSALLPLSLPCQLHRSPSSPRPELIHREQALPVHASFYPSSDYSYPLRFDFSRRNSIRRLCLPAAVPSARRLLSKSSYIIPGTDLVSSAFLYL